MLQAPSPVGVHLGALTSDGKAQAWDALYSSIKPFLTAIQHGDKEDARK